MLDFLFSSAKGNGEFSPQIIAANIIVSFLLSLVVALVYKRTHRGLSYSQSFVFSLVLLGTLLSVIMMVVGSNVARAFTLFGAFTLIRFRTAVKDTKDVAFILWTLAVGLAVGTGNYIIAAISTVLVIIIVLVLSRLNFGSIRNYDHMLAFVLDTERGGVEGYKSIFDKYLRSANLLNMSTREGGKKMEFTFNIRLIDRNQTNEFIRDLRSAPGLDHINFIPAKGDVEY